MRVRHRLEGRGDGVLQQGNTPYTNYVTFHVHYDGDKGGSDDDNSNGGDGEGGIDVIHVIMAVGFRCDFIGMGLNIVRCGYEGDSTCDDGDKDGWVDLI